jgi:biotin transport system substrate-specific component
MTTLAVSTRRRVLADIVPTSLVADLFLIGGGAAFVGLLAQVSFFVHPFVVPFTGQTLGVLVVGGTLGLRRALSAMALYVVAGLVGVPWFAGHASGYSPLLFGYLLGFVLSVSVMSWLASRGNDRNIVSALGLFIIGELAIYAIGVPWLALDLHLSLLQAVSVGMTPYLIVDLAKAVVAGTLLPATWRLVDRSDQS